MAWLNTSRDKSDNRVSRYEQMMRDSEHGIEMPELIGNEPYIVGLLNEVGPATSNGMGIQGVSWLELKSWEHLVGIELESWQASLLYRLSKVYANEYSRSNGEDTDAPYIPYADTQEAKDAVEEKGKNIFERISLAQRSNKNN